MVSRMVRIISGFMGVLMVSIFVVGLSVSISTGFAGFWGGLPFAVITATVLAMVVYDYWDECIRNKTDM